MSQPKLFFYVQHLLGIGHLRRAATLTRWLQKGGVSVTLVSGGFPIPTLKLGGADFIQLAPVRATDESFKLLVDANGVPIDDAWRKARCETLLAAYDKIQPDAVMFELFPFGRRQMRFELLPLIERAKTSVLKSMILCSVRDILVGQSKKEREQEMVDLVRAHFDHVLVHGDPDLITFDRTFPLAREIADRLVYTGYVVDETADEPTAHDDGSDEILVSAGGGAVGDKLLATALAARPLTQQQDALWRILVGAAANEDTYQALRMNAGPGVIVERARGDFPTLLKRCRLSISQGGYNTMMETLQARARAVVVPYAGGTETEQTLRADLLAAQGLLRTLPEADLTPISLSQLIDQAIAAPAPKAARLNQNGGAKSANLIRGWVENRR